MRYTAEQGDDADARRAQRPRNGASANARDPEASISSPYRATWPSAAPNEISSPGSVAKALPATYSRVAMISIATTRAVT